MIKVAYNFVASEAGWFACVLGARWNSEVRVRKPEYILDDWRANSGA